MNITLHGHWVISNAEHQYFITFFKTGGKIYLYNIQLMYVHTYFKRLMQVSCNFIENHCLNDGQET